MIRNLKYLLLGVALIILWEYFASASGTVRLYISSPSLVIGYFLENWVVLIRALLITSVEAIVGLVLATVLSFAIMCLGFAKPKFLEFLLPIMVTSQVIPLIVLAPFFILLFGLGMTSKIMMAAAISFFAIFINFNQGYRTISLNIHELMLIYNAPLAFRIMKVYFPLSMPSIMAGLKVSATLAVIGAIVAEFTGAKIGIGKNLFVSAIRLEPDMMMTSLILAALLGLLLYGIINYIDRKYGYWYQK